MRHILVLVLGILASGATVVAQSSSGTAAVVPAGPLQVELELVAVTLLLKLVDADAVRSPAVMARRVGA